MDPRRLFNFYLGIHCTRLHNFFIEETSKNVLSPLENSDEGSSYQGRNEKAPLSYEEEYDEGSYMDDREGEEVEEGRNSPHRGYRGGPGPGKGRERTAGDQRGLNKEKEAPTEQCEDEMNNGEWSVSYKKFFLSL